MNLPQKNHKFYAPASPLEFLPVIKALCGSLEFTSNDCSFHIKSPNALFDNSFLAKYLPRAQLHAQMEGSGTGTNVRVWLSNTLTNTEVCVCVLIFGAWIAERIWTLANHIEGLLIPSWQLKTVVFGPVLLLLLIGYCVNRSRQSRALLALVSKAVAICEHRESASERTV